MTLQTVPAQMHIRLDGDEWTPREVDAVVDANGYGDFLQIQDADNFFGTQPYTLWVKQGSYTENLTFATANCRIYFEPGTTVTGTLTISGDECTVRFGSGCTVTGNITLSGSYDNLICENGCTMGRIIGTGDRNLVDGGGWGTVFDGSTNGHAINVQSGADEWVLRNLSAKTSAGSGNSYSGLILDGARGQAYNCRIVDSDNNGVGMGGTDCALMDSVILDADGHGVFINGPIQRIVGVFVLSAGDDGINLNAAGDNTTITGCVIKDQTNQSIDINADSENCTVVGNKVDGAINDLSGSSTVAQNEATAF